MIPDLLAGLAHANLAAGVAIVAAALLRKPVRRAFGARAAYGLWLAAPLAAIAVLVPPMATPSPIVAPMMLEIAAVAGGAVDASVSTAPSLPAMAFWLWIMGAGAVAVLLLLRQARFVTALGRLEPLAGGLFRAERAGAGPAVVGVLRPRIVTPADFESRFAPGEREVILAHEQAHLRSGDAAINALAALALCACWFNPLVHLAVYLMRIDQELACDAAVLGRFPQARRLYAEVLLKTQLATQPLPFGCHWPAAAEHPLKERIVMLKSPLPAPARRAAGVAAVTCLSLAGACAAWAAQPGLPITVRAESDTVAAPAATRSAADATDFSAKPILAGGPRTNPTPTHAPAAAVPTLITAPNWVRRPNGAGVARVYPTTAKAHGLQGRTTMECRIDMKGLLRHCAVVSETPAGAGFGEAALQLAERFQMAATSRDGAATAGNKIRIPILWAPPSPEPGPAPLVSSPVWIEKPTLEQLVSVMPPGEPEGRALMGCRVQGDGRLTSCEIISEAPLNLGLGAAALQLAPHFRMAAKSPDGARTDGSHVRIPVRFATPQ